MRLILILLVLLYVSSFIFGDLLNCKQLCSDKKSCCSSPLNNEYYLKTMECKKPSCGVKGGDEVCLKLKNFAGSKYFGCGSVITICSVGSETSTNKLTIVGVDDDDDDNEYEEKIFSELLGESSASAALSASSAYATATADVGLSVSSITGELSSDMSSVLSSLSSGGDDGDYDDDDGAFARQNKGGNGIYKGGNGKFKDGFNHHGKSMATATADVGLAVSAVTGEVSSDMSSLMSSISSGGDDGDYDDDGVLAKIKSLGKQVYKGGSGKALKKHAKCIKVLTIDSETDFIVDGEKLDKPVVGVSKQICKKLFGSESSCDSIENQKTITVVQSTKNDGFPNKGTFQVTHEEYNMIIKHGKLLRNQCELKGKCQFNRA